jgi:polysaccharide biosynthesis/export protein
MTSLRLRFFTLLTAALVWSGPSGSQTIDEPAAPQTFNTPGYGAPNGNRAGAGATSTRLPRSSGDTDSSRAVIGNGTRDGRDPRTAGNGETNGNAPQRTFEPPPPRPGEFQKFVEAATGRLLPMFGASFFTEAARSPMGTDNVPVSADYTVGPGDEIVIRAWGSVDIDYRATVDRSGQLNLPKVGSFNVAGVKAADLEKNLRAQIGRLYTNFNLTVSLGQLRGLRIFVVGPAQRPGVYTLPSQATMLSAMVAAGGPAPFGSMRKVLLRRDGRVVSELDVYEFLVQGDKSKDVQLAAGDVVVFQPAGPRVAVHGAIDAPAIYELRSREEPLREVLRYAGGTPVLANLNRAQLERIDPAQAKAARFVEEFRLDGDSLQRPLRDGDILTLLAISPQFANAVTLRGHVAQPLRYPHRPGMRIRDLIPDRDALISPDFYRRKNLLVQVIEDDQDRPLQRESEVRTLVEPQRTTPPVGAASPYGAAPRGAVNSQTSPAAGQVGNGNANGAGVLITPQQARMAELDAERAERQRPRRAPTPLFDALNWDYAVIERLNLKDLSTEVIPFNLGKAVLQGEEASNIELMPGDVVTVFSQKDVRVPVARQTRLVAVEGEVGAPGVYQLLPGETLKSLIARAGGLTPQAYVYGLEFSREETRRRQRENLDQALARLESLSAIQSARDAANRRDEASAASTTAASNAATQAQLARLSQLQPNGRIALELSPTTTSLEALPDVPLEHADRVAVPSRPGFVTVAGAVVNSNAFLWKPGRTAGEYLRLAGADEAADPGNMFILRADGTVSHAGDRRGWFGRNSLESLEMQPGDALIVPNQLDFETWGRALVRNLKDWSQIFSQFGLGIAAINSLNN